MLDKIANAFMGTIDDLVNTDRPIVSILLQENRYLYIVLLIATSILILQ